MYLLSVMPISTSAHTDVLDYYSKDPVGAGMIVQISLRRKNINGLVLSSVHVSEAKHTIKNSRFALKKITSVVGPSPINTNTLHGIQLLSRYLATTSGVIIANTLPAWLFLSNLKFEQNVSNKDKADSKKYALQASIADRTQYYKKEIANGKRLLIICPTEDHQKSIVESLSSDTAVHILPAKPSAKKLSKLFEQLNTTHPSIIISSPTGIGLINVLAPDLLVIEHESDNRYIRQKTPHLDMRIIAEHIARSNGVDYMVADTMLRTYTHSRVAEKELVSIQKLQWPLLDTVNVISYVKDPNDKEQKRNPFFSEELVSIIKKQKPTDKLVVYVPRKGLAPTVVCEDCGTAVVCEVCNLPQRLIEKKDPKGIRKRLFACAYPEHTISAYDHCKQCGGHRLKGLGVSTLAIRDELKKLFPEKTFFVLDQDEAQKTKEQKTIIEKFQQTPSAILIGTSLVTSYLDADVTHIIVPSLDMLLSHPSPDAQESIMHLLASFEEKANASITIQTRLPHNPIFEALQKHSIADWFKQDQDLRKHYQFPPFVVWISVHAYFSGSAAEGFQKVIGSIPLRPHTISIAQGRGTKQLHGVATFKIPTSKWNMDYQEPTLFQAFMALPFGYHVEYSTRIS